jgi:hypothetical protein
MAGTPNTWLRDAQLLLDAGTYRYGWTVYLGKSFCYGYFRDELCAHEKDKKHSHYLHDGSAIRFAFDSMGGISQSAKDCLDHLYARGTLEKRRRWDSETMRIVLKKELLDRLSMLLCLHRVFDFKFLGIPNMRGGRYTTSTPSSLDLALITKFSFVTLVNSLLHVIC